MQSESEVRIIRAATEDASRIAPLFDAYRVFYDQTSNLDAAGSFLRQRLEHNESMIFVALVGSDGSATAAGFTQLYPVFSSISMTPAWILNDLYVDPDHRQRGIARRLMERAAAFAKETGARYLALETAIDNAPARRLYESLGWTRDNEFHRYTLVVDGAQT